MNPIFMRNLSAVSLRDPPLSVLLESCPASPDFQIIRARSGSAVPALRRSGRLFPLHSTFDPEKEGSRFRAEHASAGFCVFLGLGAGFHIRPFARDPEVAGIFVVEHDPCLLRATLESVDFSSLLSDERFHIILDPAPGVIEQTLLREYLPAVMGNMACVPLRSRVGLDGDFFSEILEEIERAASRLRADYATQARFGKRWFTNVLFNLPLAEKTGEIPETAHAVLVIGAGPSLDIHAESINENRKGRFLVSTDTALPALLARGIRPDLAVSIDCQHYGYLHTLAPEAVPGSVQGIPFLLDLASPPSLVRHARVSGFFASGHPFCQYIRRYWKPFPSLDTSGGNVSHAAVSLARTLGSKEILLYGMDFSYPNGKAYARGTYLSHLFVSHSSRLSPLDSSFFSLIFGKGDIQSERMTDGWRYTTPLLLSYRKSMERLLNSFIASVSCFKGRGLPLRLSKGIPTQVSTLSGHGPTDTVPSPPKGMSWKLFLEDYGRKIEELPEPSNPLAFYLRSLSLPQRETWVTLLPLVPCIERETGGLTDRRRLLTDARDWALSRVRRTLLFRP